MVDWRLIWKWKQEDRKKKWGRGKEGGKRGKMEYGRWNMEDGEWRIENEGWRMEKKSKQSQASNMVIEKEHYLVIFNDDNNSLIKRRIKSVK